ncbi:hypothetical protein K474DRAFT_1737747 [Panus rudis PR-1116 ss-1]|nr:hypothetical protein K474DRAFT_1737747 [Panus rudis PR-1116 ss-1]
MAGACLLWQVLLFLLCMTNADSCAAASHCTHSSAPFVYVPAASEFTGCTCPSPNGANTGLRDLLRLSDPSFHALLPAFCTTFATISLHPRESARYSACLSPISLRREEGYSRVHILEDLLLNVFSIDSEANQVRRTRVYNETRYGGDIHSIVKQETEGIVHIPSAVISPHEMRLLHSSTEAEPQPVSPTALQVPAPVPSPSPSHPVIHDTLPGKRLNPLPVLFENVAASPLPDLHKAVSTLQPPTHTPSYRYRKSLQRAALPVYQPIEATKQRRKSWLGATVTLASLVDFRFQILAVTVIGSGSGMGWERWLRWGVRIRTSAGAGGSS